MVTCGTCGRDGGHGSTGLSRCPFEPGTSHAVKQDTLIGGFWAENAWREPRYFDSQKKYEKALDESGLMLKPKKLRGAEPISAETLAWAIGRLARIEARTKSVPIEERVIEETFTVDADA